LEAEATKQFTHALLHTQPAGTFHQVSDDPMLAIKCLVTMCEGALSKHRRSPTSPTAEIDDSDKPLRVKITVSSPRVRNEATPPRVVLPTTPNITVPNSHHRLQQTQCRAVTPSNPHHIVRISAAPQNLSDGMLAETVQQENHFLSLPTGSVIKTANSAINNEPVVIMTEIANAAICPNTGKSLKHKELKTILRYKIRWMISRNKNDTTCTVYCLVYSLPAQNNKDFENTQNIPSLVFFVLNEERFNHLFEVRLQHS
jgi:hypothetical protein